MIRAGDGKKPLMKWTLGLGVKFVGSRSQQNQMIDLSKKSGFEEQSVRTLVIMKFYNCYLKEAITLLEG